MKKCTYPVVNSVQNQIVQNKTDASVEEAVIELTLKLFRQFFIGGSFSRKAVGFFPEDLALNISRIHPNLQLELMDYDLYAQDLLKMTQDERVALCERNNRFKIEQWKEVETKKKQNELPEYFEFKTWVDEFFVIIDFQSLTYSILGGLGWAETTYRGFNECFSNKRLDDWEENLRKFLLQCPHLIYSTYFAFL